MAKKNPKAPPPTPPELLKLVRSTLRPCTIVTPQKARKRAASDAAHATTRFAGEPYAEKGDTWPMCGCGRPLTFVFQWNLAECPHADDGKGVYSFYYCFLCSSWGDIPEDVKDAWVVRFHAAAGEERAVAMPRPAPKGIAKGDAVNLRPCACTLKKGVSAPDWESAGEKIVELCRRVGPDELWEVYHRAEAELGATAGDEPTRIGGYPRWVQGENTPTCRSCRKEMELIAEIGSEDEHAGVMWGDMGSVYLFECAKHRGTFDMRLQCF